MNHSFREELGRAPECPELNELFAALDREPEDAERRRMEAHAEECAACHTEIALFRGFMSADVRPEERSAVRDIVAHLGTSIHEPGQRPESWWRRFLQPAWGGGAALALAALVLTLGISFEYRSRHPQGPMATEPDVLRSRLIHITSATGEVEQVPGEVAWESIPGAISYVVALTEVDGTQIFYSKVTASPLLLPPSVHKLVIPGKQVSLRVIAEDKNGGEIASSGTLRIRLKPQSQ